MVKRQNPGARIQNSGGRLGFSENVGFNAECAEGRRGIRQQSSLGTWNSTGASDLERSEQASI